MSPKKKLKSGRRASFTDTKFGGGGKRGRSDSDESSDFLIQRIIRFDELEEAGKNSSPNPFPLCPPERSVSAARSAAISRSFIQKRFELRSAIANNQDAIPMNHQCQQLKQKFKKLKTLRDDFVIEFNRVQARGKLDRAKQLKKELEEALSELKKELRVSPERAREIMRENFYGQEEIKNAFGFEVSGSGIPPIPYNREQLQQAKKLGEMLILRVSRDGEGKPMTMERINEIMKSRMDKVTEGRLLFNTDWYKNEEFYKNASLKTEWRLVGSSFVPDVNSKKDNKGKYAKDSRNQDYIHQTRLLRDYLKSVDSLTDEEEQGCSDDILKTLSAQMGFDWDSQELIDSDKYEADWKKVARSLSLLQVNVSHRRSPAEIIYDWTLWFKKTKDRGALYDNMDVSHVMSSEDGYLVDVGCTSIIGMSVLKARPSTIGEHNGVVSVR